MQQPDIRSIIRRILLAVFLPALIAGAVGFYLLLQGRATQVAEEEARIMLATARSVRAYTNERIVPQLSTLASDRFREETVPSFAAQTVFRNAVTGGYRYRETALNPTNPLDRPDAFEVDLVRRFRAEAGLLEMSGIADLEQERVFYVAHPIRITDPACLVCHDTPERAPPAMLAKYGSGNGFGWKLGETVGTQLVTIPVTKQFAGTIALVGLLIGGVALVFVAAYLALVTAMDRQLVRPLQALADSADHASRQSTGRALPMGETRELRRLAAAIERLRTSLRKALGELEGRGGGRAGGRTGTGDD